MILKEFQKFREYEMNCNVLSALYVPLIRMALLWVLGGSPAGKLLVLEDRGIITVGELVFFSMMIQRLLWP